MTKASYSRIDAGILPPGGFILRGVPIGGELDRAAPRTRRSPCDPRRRYPAGRPTRCALGRGPVGLDTKGGDSGPVVRSLVYTTAVAFVGPSPAWEGVEMSDLVRARLDERPRHAAAVKERCEGRSVGSPHRRKHSADEAAEKEPSVRPSMKVLTPWPIRKPPNS